MLIKIEFMASSYSPPVNDVSGNPNFGTPPSDEFGNPMNPNDYKVPGDDFLMMTMRSQMEVLVEI